MANNDFNDCYEYKDRQHSIVEATLANKTRYEFDNRYSKFYASKWQVDGCLIRHDSACDWLFELRKDSIEQNLHAVFVELKDSDLIKAVSQIDNSINKLGFKVGKHLIHARIVLTKTYAPDINDNRVKKFIKTIETAGGTVDYKSQKLEENKIK